MTLISVSVIKALVPRGLALCLLCPFASADSLVIANARLIDGTAKAPIAGVSIVIESNRIKSISGELTTAQHYRVIDASGKTVLPGLVDAHTHALLDERESGVFWLPSSDEEMDRFMQETVPDRMRSYLESGITSIISTGDYSRHVVDLRNRIRDGQIAGPRLFVTGRLFTAPGGHPVTTVCGGEKWCRDNLAAEVEDEQSARQWVRRLAAQGVDGIKLVYDSDWLPPRMDKPVMAAVVDEAHNNHLPVIAHSSSVADTLDLVHAGVDALAHLPESSDESEIRRLAGELAKRHIPVSTTLSIIAQYVETETEFSADSDAGEMLQWRMNTAKVLAEEGVALNLGTDTLAPLAEPGASVLSEARILVQAGLSPAHIIRAATGQAARHPMMPDDIGTIEVGKLADILIVAGDPLKDIEALSNVELVIKDGKIVFDRRSPPSAREDSFHR